MKKLTKILWRYATSKLYEMHLTDRLILRFCLENVKCYHFDAMKGVADVVIVCFRFIIILINIS